MSRSKFPEGVDSFVELFDLPYDKMKSAERLTLLKMQASLSNDEQNELSALTSELEDYIITPEHWNKFGDSLVAVQTFFNDNVKGFIENKQKLWDTYIKNFKYIGKWTGSKQYKFQNMVIGEDGDLFLCKKDHTSNSGNGVTNSEFWQRVSSKGDKGDIGLNASYKGDWSDVKEYDIGDAVSYKREGWKTPLVYISNMKSNIGNKPELGKGWFLYSQLYVGNTVPAGASAGLHFIKVLE